MSQELIQVCGLVRQEAVDCEDRLGYDPGGSRIKKITLDADF